METTTDALADATVDAKLQKESRKAWILFWTFRILHTYDFITDILLSIEWFSGVSSTQSSIKNYQCIDNLNDQLTLVASVLVICSIIGFVQAIIDGRNTYKDKLEKINQQKQGSTKNTQHAYDGQDKDRTQYTSTCKSLILKIGKLIIEDLVSVLLVSYVYYETSVMPSTIAIMSLSISTFFVLYSSFKIFVYMSCCLFISTKRREECQVSLSKCQSGIALFVSLFIFSWIFVIVYWNLAIFINFFDEKEGLLRDNVSIITVTQLQYDVDDDGDNIIEQDCLLVIGIDYTFLGESTNQFVYEDDPFYCYLPSKWNDYDYNNKQDYVLCDANEYAFSDIFFLETTSNTTRIELNNCGNVTYVTDPDNDPVTQQICYEKCVFGFSF